MLARVLLVNLVFVLVLLAATKLTGHSQMLQISQKDWLVASAETNAFPASHQPTSCRRWWRYWSYHRWFSARRCYRPWQPALEKGY